MVTNSQKKLMYTTSEALNLDSFLTIIRSLNMFKTNLGHLKTR